MPEVEEQQQSTEPEDRVSQIAQEQLKQIESESKGAETSEPDPANDADAGEDVEKTEEQDGVETDPEAEKVKKIEGKVEKRKAELNAEIGALVAKQKALEEKFGKVDVEAITNEIDALRNRLAELERPKAEQSLKQKLSKAEEDRIVSYMSEDHGKPREEKREMTKEELDDWLVEDQVSAYEWMIERNMRRARERDADSNNQKSLANLEEFKAKQAKSREKMYQSFPDIKASVEKGMQLVAQGKTEQEAHAILAEENPNYKAMLEIVDKNPKYLEMTDGPERVAEEIAKRGKGQKTYTEEDLKKAREEAAQMERDRLKKVDAGISGGNGRMELPKSVDATIAEGGRLMTAAMKYTTKHIGKTFGEKEYKEALERRNTIPGSNVR